MAIIHVVGPYLPEGLSLTDPRHTYLQESPVIMSVLLQSTSNPFRTRLYQHLCSVAYAYLHSRFKRGSQLVTSVDSTIIACRSISGRTRSISVLAVGSFGAELHNSSQIPIHSEYSGSQKDTSYSKWTY